MPKPIAPTVNALRDRFLSTLRTAKSSNVFMM